MTKKLIAVRLTENWLEQIDRLRPYFSTPWREANRSDVLRAIILYRLDEVAGGAGLQLRSDDDDPGE